VGATGPTGATGPAGGGGSTSLKAVLVADTVNQLRKAGNVLVHCEAGLNRSGMICALALMRGNEKMTARQVIDHLRKTRDFSVLCNFTFEKFLLSHDENSKAKDTC
jgi:protein-tyrosine phosphatase